MRSALSLIVAAITLCTMTGFTLSEMIYNFGGSSAYSGGGADSVSRDADFDAQVQRWDGYRT